jgi:hypothetical protein
LSVAIGLGPSGPVEGAQKGFRRLDGDNRLLKVIEDESFPYVMVIGRQEAQAVAA